MVSTAEEPTTEQKRAMDELVREYGASAVVAVMVVDGNVAVCWRNTGTIVNATKILELGLDIVRTNILQNAEPPAGQPLS